MTEFFISSNSCQPGGIRSHANLCTDNFQIALNFAIESVSL